MDLEGISLVDGHAHPIWREALLIFTEAFTEGREPTFDTLFYRRSCRALAELLECPEEDLLEERRRRGLEALYREYLTRGRVGILLLDDGWRPEACLPLSWHAEGVAVHRVLRVETLAEGITSPTFSDYVEQFLHQLEIAEVVGLKSIAAYRGGLRLTRPTAGEAAEAWALRSPRLTDRRLLDHLLWMALEVASQRHLPVQWHTGFGDSDLSLELSNPLHLQPLVEAFPNVPFVLLHAGYPYPREAGWLASVYPNVHVDFGLAVPFLSRAGMRDTLTALLHLSPTGRLMYSSDASRIPELFYLGAREGRRVVGEVLAASVADGDLSWSEAETVAQDLLADNARRLYRV